MHVNDSNLFNRVEPANVIVARMRPYDVSIMGYNIPAEVTIMTLCR